MAGLSLPGLTLRLPGLGAAPASGASQGSSSGLSYSPGDIRIAASQPSPGSWLKANGAYVAPGAYPQLPAAYAPLPVTFVGGSTSFSSKGPVAYGNGMFVTVAMASNGTYYAYTSTDGRAWTQGPALAAYTSLFFCNGLFIATDGINIAYSGNATAWTTVSNAFAKTINCILYAAGVFVAFGDTSIYTATTPASWTLVYSPSTVIYTACFANGAFYAYSSTAATVYVSADGQSWTAKSTTLTITGLAGPTTTAFAGGIYGIACGNGVFVANMNSIIAYSYDGLNWTQGYACIIAPGNSFNFVFASGIFVMLNGANQYVYASVDGVNWNVISKLGSVVTTPGFNCFLAYGGGIWATGPIGGVSYASTGSMILLPDVPNGFIYLGP